MPLKRVIVYPGDDVLGVLGCSSPGLNFALQCYCREVRLGLREVKEKLSGKDIEAIRKVFEGVEIGVGERIGDLIADRLDLVGEDFGVSGKDLDRMIEVVEGFEVRAIWALVGLIRA